MNSRGPSNKEFHYQLLCSCISCIMPGDFKVVCIKQVFRFNSVHIKNVPEKLAQRTCYTLLAGIVVCTHCTGSGVSS